MSTRIYAFIITSCTVLICFGQTPVTIDYQGNRITGQTPSSMESLNVPEFTEIPAGSFTMGADLDPKYIAAWRDEGWRSIFIQDEFPTREITISQPFSISKYEITNNQFELFDPSHNAWRGHFMNISEGDNESVVYVSWEEAVAYTAWLSENDPQYDYRLPTEAEWEYVARAGTRTPFNDGTEGEIYDLNPFNASEMTDLNYQWPYPFTYSNDCRSWVTWRPDNCTGINDVYPDNDDIKDAVLTVGRHGPNGFGVYDMHGGVEEWVLDWYGPYNSEETTDPAGYTTGDFKVTRGGSHNNHVQHTRSANRMGSAVNDKHYLLGFRVVRVPEGKANPTPQYEPPARPWAFTPNTTPWNWCEDDPDPVFDMTSLYELVPAKQDGSHYGTDEQLRQFGFDPDSRLPLLTGPLYSHNHSPTVAWTENGDLLVSWFSGESETGPELTLLGSRGVRQEDGSLEWTAPAEFLKAPDRNMHGSNLLNNALRVDAGNDETLTLHQVASVGVAGRWDKLALGVRQSTDHGKTWTPVRMILELDHGLNHGAQMQGNMFQTSDGILGFVTDDADDAKYNTASLVVTTDNGITWERRGYSGDTPGEQRIAGIHAAVAEIEDVNNDGFNDLLAYARDKGVHFDGLAPQSVSVDGGYTWTRSASVFPAIGTGQRMTLTRLRYSDDHPEFPGKKPLLFTGFAEDGIQGRDGIGLMNTIHGLYAALSFDEGATWPAEYRRVISNMGVNEFYEFEAAPWQRTHEISRTTGQWDGYMSATQTPDGMVYLTDGKIVYNFNLAWLMEGATVSTVNQPSVHAFRLYPNPAGEAFNISLDHAFTGDMDLKVFSSEGKILLCRKLRKNSSSFTSTIKTDLQTGVYLVVLEGAGYQNQQWLTIYQ